MDMYHIVSPKKHYKELRKMKSLLLQVPFFQWSEQPFDGYHHIPSSCHTLHRSHDGLLYCSKLYHNHSVPSWCIILLRQSLSHLHVKRRFCPKNRKSDFFFHYFSPTVISYLYLIYYLSFCSLFSLKQAACRIYIEPSFLRTTNTVLNNTFYI